MVIDAYFSATKVEWIIKNVAGAQKLAEEGRLIFGTVDSWLIWKFSEGESHVTDVTNASRTMLFDITKKTFCLEDLEIVGVILPMIVYANLVVWLYLLAVMVAGVYALVL